MAFTDLPQQAPWPEHLFRVTSSLTWRRTSTPFSFVSPAQQLKCQDLELEHEFPSKAQFNDAFSRHLKAAHDIWTGSKFHTPFISTTTSFRYALSVAELHHRRGGINIAIAIIDTTILQHRKPIWDAANVASLIHLVSSRNECKDEFLVFGAIHASQNSFKSMLYNDLVYKLGSFMPELLDKQQSKRARFSDFWQDMPKRTKPYKAHEATAAFQIAHSMTTSRLMFPLMIMVLLLQERGSYGQSCIDEIVGLVSNSPQLRKEDHVAYFNFVLRATFVHQSAGEDVNKSMSVYDYLDMTYCSCPKTASPAVKYLAKCLAALRQKLHKDQASTIYERFNLTDTALVIRQFTKDRTDLIVKCTDRRTKDFCDVLAQYVGAGELSLAFSRLRATVKACAHRPLSRLNALLHEIKDNIPRGDENVAISFWTKQFERIRVDVEGKTSRAGRGAGAGNGKRKIDEVDAVERRATKRVKVETTEFNITMTVKKTTERGVKQERVSW